MRALLIALFLSGAAPMPSAAIPPSEVSDMLLDDFTRADGRSVLGTRWNAMSDRVMGGVSDVSAARVEGERPHLHLTGQVKNVPGYGSPGFVQLGLDLGQLDASGFTGIRLVVRGDGGRYGAHLRTPDVRRPWQSFRGSFVAPAEWTEVRIPFDDFEPYRIGVPLDPARLRRLSLIAVDRVGSADLRVSEVSLYR